jgi:hypothetical protein
VAGAALAALLLVAIAIYYTSGKSFAAKHVRLHTPHVPLAWSAQRYGPDITVA